VRQQTLAVQTGFESYAEVVALSLKPTHYPLRHWIGEFFRASLVRSPLKTPLSPAESDSSEKLAQIGRAAL